MVGPPVGQAVDQPRIAVEGEDDRLVGGEDGVEVAIREPVGVLLRRLQLHQVHHVDHPDLQLRQVPAQELNGGQGLQRRHVAAAGHDHVGLAVLVVAGPFPDAEARRAMLDRLVHAQPLRRRLLAGDDHVDVVAAAQTVIRHRKQRVGVRRQVDPDHLGLLVDHVVDEAGILMAETVVILAPDMRAEEIVERGDRPPPRDLAAHLQPLRVLIEH